MQNDFNGPDCAASSAGNSILDLIDYPCDPDLDGNGDHSSADVTEPPLSATSVILTQRGPGRVLLGDDDAGIQQCAVRMMNQQGHSVIVAKNADEALAALQGKSFELVLLNLQNP